MSVAAGDDAALADALRGAALGGRVRSTGFLEPADADRVAAAVRSPGVEVEAWGGYPGARRRVVTARPDHVPEARPALAAVYLPEVAEEVALRSALRARGVAASALGDVVLHQDGASVVTLDPPPAALLEEVAVGGLRTQGRVVGLDLVAGGRARELEAVVPALRLDVLGARAFGVSRSYFAKGVAAGRVSVNGSVAGKRAEVAEGDEVWAEGLGRFSVRAITGTTRRGNLKVRLAVERA
jgi:RNA-binding protein YlmH